MPNPAHWTLRTKLVISTLALFIVTMSGIGIATVLVTRSNLMSQVDGQLTAAQQTLARDGNANEGTERTHHQPPGLGGSSLRVTFDSTSTPSHLVIDENSVSPVTPGAAATTLTAAQLSTLYADARTRPQTVELPGKGGRYRVILAPRADGDLTVVGFPLEPVERNVDKLATTVALLGLLGLVAVGTAGLLGVQSSLRPLRRVASTAERVSELPLGQGDVRTDERVPTSDTDPHTEVGTVGLALNNLLDHVDAALDSRQQSELQVRQFVADASHELRTPLASIRGYAELSRRETDPVPASITHALNRIESEAGRMTALVEDLLLLARLDAGRPLEREPVDLTRIVVESLSDLHAAGPDHIWHLDLPDDPEDFPEIVGDEARLRQVVINLLANSRRHTPPGTTVTAGLHRAGDNVVITVTDNGPGIPADLLPHLFERFTRGDSARTRSEGSTGLGLSIVDAVVAAHHGHVTVDSTPGSTRFSISLPAHGGTP